MEPHKKHRSDAKKIKNVNLGLVVVSTSRYEEEKRKEQSSDKTIPLVREILNGKQDISLTYTKIIPDNETKLKNILEKGKNDEINVLIFSGGTGLTPKDITYETIEPLLQKKITGFGELFRYLSYKEIGSAAMISRAIAGSFNKMAIFLLPGSPNAVKLALEKLILPEIFHIVHMINKVE
ncbi:MAG: MogA/MoaB family molybdenum cofactor biosynthesis protein [Promethearchaeia archaeon]